MLLLAVLALGLQAFLSRSQRGARLMPGLGFFERFLDQGYQPLDGVEAILFLSTVAFSLDNQDTVIGHAAAGQLDQAFFYVGRQAGCAADVEPQLSRRRYLVDVLPPGARRAHEIDLYFILVNRDRRADFDHPRSISKARTYGKTGLPEILSVPDISLEHALCIEDGYSGFRQFCSVRIAIHVIDQELQNSACRLDNIQSMKFGCQFPGQAPFRAIGGHDLVQDSGKV